MLRHPLAMIGGENDQRVICMIALLQRPNYHGDFGVYLLNYAVIGPDVITPV